MNRFKNTFLFILLLIPLESVVAFGGVEHKITQAKEISSSDIDTFERHKTISIQSPTLEFSRGQIVMKHQEKFLKVLNKLSLNPPKEGLYVNCDSDGKIWAVNSGNQKIIVDSESGDIIYKESGQKIISISPGDKVIVLKEEEGDEDSYLSRSIVIDSNSKSVLLKESEDLDVDEETFIGHDRWVWADSNKTKKGFLIDLNNPSFRIPMERGDVPTGAIEIPGSGQLFGISAKSKAMAFFNIDSLKEIAANNEIGVGVPYVNDNGSLICTNDGIRVYFYNLSNQKGIGIGISENDKNYFVITERKKISGIGFDKNGNSDRSKVVYRFRDEIKSFIDLNSGEEKPLGNTPLNFQKALHLRRFKKGPSSNAANVFPDQSGKGFFAVFNRWNDSQHGDSIIVHVGEDLNISEIIHWGHVVSNISRFDKESGAVISFDKNEKRVFEIDINSN